MSEKWRIFCVCVSPRGPLSYLLYYPSSLSYKHVEQVHGKENIILCLPFPEILNCLTSPVSLYEYFKIWASFLAAFVVASCLSHVLPEVNQFMCTICRESFVILWNSIHVFVLQPQGFDTLKKSYACVGYVSLFVRIWAMIYFLFKEGVCMSIHMSWGGQWCSRGRENLKEVPCWVCNWTWDHDLSGNQASTI